MKLNQKTISEGSMKINYQNMLNTPNTQVKITAEELAGTLEKTKTIITQLNNGEGDIKDKTVKMIGWQDYAVNLTAEEINNIIDKSQALAKRSDILFVIGIGGSYLGPKAVIEAIYGKNYNDIISPKIYFLGCDTDPDFYSHCLKIATGKKVGAIVISKSGTTTEPGIAFRFIKELIENQHGSAAKEQIIAVTDQAKGALRKLADEEGYETFVIPDDIGGRFSVITPVGLVPIAAAGIDIKEYIKGYIDTKKLLDSTDNIENNPAAVYAALRYIAWTKGAAVEYQTTNSSFFEANIFWTMQLEPESEGHQGHGIHVVPAVYPRDLHSIGQIVQQGPRNIIEIATKIMGTDNDLVIPRSEANLDELNYIPENKLSLNEINKMTIDGPLAAHYADGVPNMTIEIEKITPRNIGKYHFMLMKATGIQGFLMGHNPFIQPGVQFWKDKLFTMAGKPGYEAAHAEYKKSLENTTAKNIVSF